MSNFCEVIILSKIVIHIKTFFFFFEVTQFISVGGKIVYILLICTWLLWGCTMWIVVVFCCLCVWMKW